MKTYRPRGFTLVELLVVITIIGMLMALLVPAVGAARARARQTQCLNNMGQAAKALLTYESTKQGFPGRVNDVNYQPLSGSPGVVAVSWAGMLLPYAERSDVWESLRTGTLPMNNIPRVDLLICPADVQASAATPGLSFVGNAGHWDVGSTNNPAGDFPENGVFLGMAVMVNGQWRAASGPKITLDSISDGVATTMLISENIQAGPPESPTGAPEEPASWVFSPTEQGDGFSWINEYPIMNQATINREKEVNPSYKSVRHCRPSSNHPDGVNVAYCDAHVSFLRDDIDYKVYQQLMTPKGRSAKVPPNSNTPADKFLGDNYYLLNAKDYE